MERSRQSQNVSHNLLRPQAFPFPPFPSSDDSVIPLPSRVDCNARVLHLGAFEWPAPSTAVERIQHLAERTGESAAPTKIFMSVPRHALTHSCLAPKFDPHDEHPVLCLFETSIERCIYAASAVCLPAVGGHRAGWGSRSPYPGTYLSAYLFAQVPIDGSINLIGPRWPPLLGLFLCVPNPTHPHSSPLPESTNHRASRDGSEVVPVRSPCSAPG